MGWSGNANRGFEEDEGGKNKGRREGGSLILRIPQNILGILAGHCGREN